MSPDDFRHLRSALKDLLPGKHHHARRKAILEVAAFATTRPGFAADGPMTVHLRIMRDHGGWFDGDQRVELRYAIEMDLRGAGRRAA